LFVGEGRKKEREKEREEREIVVPEIYMCVCLTKKKVFCAESVEKNSFKKSFFILILYSNIYNFPIKYYCTKILI